MNHCLQSECIPKKQIKELHPCGKETLNNFFSTSVGRSLIDDDEDDDFWVGARGVHADNPKPLSFPTEVT